MPKIAAMKSGQSAQNST